MYHGAGLSLNIAKRKRANGAGARHGALGRKVINAKAICAFGATMLPIVREIGHNRVPHS